MSAIELLGAYASGTVNVQTEYGVFEPVVRGNAAPEAFDAIRAVLSRHSDDGAGRCAECAYLPGAELPVAYPCATVKAVTEALAGGASS